MRYELLLLAELGFGLDLGRCVVTGGDAGRIGTFSFYSRIGTIFAPLLMGVLWDVAGPQISFLGITAWSSCMFFAVTRIENPQKADAVIGKATRKATSKC